MAKAFVAGEPTWDAVVVGAGAAGLYAAQLLARDGLRVIVLEASDYVGGRIRQLDGFASWRIDLGAEFVHGRHPVLDELMSGEPRHATHEFPVDFDPTVAEVPENAQLAYFGKENRLEPFYSKTDPDLVAMRKVLRDIDDLVDREKYTESDSVLKYAVDHGITSRGLGVLDSILAKTDGAEMSEMGILAKMHETDAWASGYGNWHLDRSFSVVIDRLKAGLRIELRAPVRSIDYRVPGHVVVTTQEHSYSTRYVVNTAPATVWRDGDIHYEPALPSAVIEGWRSTGMGGGMKCICLFKRRFWPSDAGLVVCGESIAAQVWFDGGHVRQTENEFLATAFIVSTAAQTLSNRTHKQVTQLFLDQLDAMFGTADSPSPASDSFVRSVVYDWQKHPFVRGMYTHGRLPGLRERLGKPIADCIFPAGEATDSPGNSCVQGALDSAVRAHREIMTRHRAHHPAARL